MAISPDGLIEAANIISALLFAAGHLPGTAAMTTLTPLLLFRCFLFNGGLGLGFGYLYRSPYWLRGNARQG
jgi:membrane protease YdiL (CAAX protease family)